MYQTLKYYLMLLSLFLTTTSTGTDTLYYSNYQEMVISNYPLIKKANLQDEISDAYLQKGAGALDPKFFTAFDAKSFKQTNYYRMWDAEVKVPTRLPVDLAIGYENNTGENINAENLVPSSGLVYGTLNINLLRGLMFDEQRYQLLDAELKGVKSQIEKDALLREVVFQSTQAYLEWAAAYYQKSLYDNYLQIVKDRHQNIVQLFINGDKPAVDTVESLVTINSAEKLFLETTEELVWKTQKLSLFLWDSDGTPLTLASTVIPQFLDSLIIQFRSLSEIQNPSFVNDPKIRKLENEINQTNLANRLVKEQLKPQLDLKFNQIINLGKDNLSLSYSPRDYKVGASLEIPILNRKTKGAIRLNEARIDQTRLDQAFYLQYLNNQYETLRSSVELKENILDVSITKANNSQLLYEAELLKFDLGESSVFLLNQRERKFLEARLEILKSNKGLGNLLNALYYLRLGQGDGSN